MAENRIRCSDEVKKEFEHLKIDTGAKNQNEMLKKLIEDYKDSKG